MTFVLGIAFGLMRRGGATLPVLNASLNKENENVEQFRKLIEQERGGARR